MTCHSHPRILLRITVVCGIAFALSGCGDLIPPRPPVSIKGDAGDSAPLTDGTESNQGSQLAEADEVDEPYEGDWSDWYVHRYGDRVVGVSRLSAESSLNLDRLELGPTDVKYLRTQQIVFQSGRVSFIRSVTETSYESPGGEFQRFDSQWTTGPVSGEIKGSVQNRSLLIKATGENAFEARVDSPEGLRSRFALEQTLRRRPIADGEVRRFSVVSPSLRSTNVLLLRCEGDTSVRWLDGSTRTLKEVKAEWSQGGQVVDESIVWVNESGEIEKQLRSGMSLESFRTDRRTADELFGQRRTDKVKISVQTAVNLPETPEEILFLISKLDDSRAEDETSGVMPPIPAIGSQSIRRLGQQTSVLVGNESGVWETFEREDSVADERDLVSTGLLDHESQAVRQFSNRVEEMRPSELAIELAKQVNQRLSLVPQGKLRKASEIFRSGRGGEVDHAIGLASVLRSRQIPARVAFGLTMDRDKGSEAENDSNQRVEMKLTAWVLASVDDRWLAIDPMRSEVSGADRICLEIASGERDFNQVFADVFRMTTQLSIEMVDAK